MTPTRVLSGVISNNQWQESQGTENLLIFMNKLPRSKDKTSNVLSDNSTTHSSSRISETDRQLKQAQLFLESAPDATFVVNETGHIVLANREAEYLFGYTREELLELQIEALMPKRYREKHLNHRQQFSSDPVLRDMGAGLSIIALTKSGSEIPVDIRLSPIKSEGKTFFSAAVRDITSRIDNEQSLQDAKNIAERATREKSRFLAAASHDLRQPLQAISLYLSVLDRTEEPTKRKDISKKIQLSLDNVNGMLGALLDVSKFDNDAIQPEIKDIPIQELFDLVLAGNQQQAEEKNLVLECIGSSAVVTTDPTLLERVIENLVTNAIRYTEQGKITITATKSKDDLLIAVSDTGIGIEHQQFDQIFEEYYQLENPMRSRTNGLGLGLSIVKHIARLLNLTIDVQSEVNRGSTFTVRVPLAKEHPANKEDTASESTASHSVNRASQIILIDDDPEILESTTMLLEISGYQVIAAESGIKALSLVDTKTYPVTIISDFRLPGMNGIEVIRALRNKYKRIIPAIIVTGDTASSKIAKVDLPKCQVLYKPVDPTALIDLVQQEAYLS